MSLLPSKDESLPPLKVQLLVKLATETQSPHGGVGHEGNMVGLLMASVRGTVTPEAHEKMTPEARIALADVVSYRPQNQKIYGEFVTTHLRHPELFNLYERFVEETVQCGHKHQSSDFILHRVRWETTVNTADETKRTDFKVNNNYSKYYAEHYMLGHPDRRGFFQLRRTNVPL